MKFQSYKSNEIGLEFKVWAPSFNRVDQRLYLLGSLKELGAWAIESALEAYPTKDLQIWNVQTALPPKSRFEWVWLKIDTKTKKVVWERPVKRNRIVGCFSGVLHTVWGEHEEVFLQSATHVDVTTFKKVEEGSVLALTGSAITLGNWDPRRTVIASEFPNKSGFWKARFCFDAHTNIEFKWVVVDDKARDNVIAAEKLPHKLYGRNTWIRVAAPWMTTSAVVVDILPLDEKLDNQMGRTDMIVQARMKRMTEIRSWMAKGRVAINLQRPFASFTTIRQSQTYTDIVHDADVCAALKALWTIVPKENDELDQRPTTDQQRKGSLGSSKTRDIKGVGQTHVPTDATNMGCLAWSELLPEGDRRVLEYPISGDVSLWTLSMDMVKKSLQATGEKAIVGQEQAEIDDGESTNTAGVEQQALGEPLTIEGGKVVTTPVTGSDSDADKVTVLEKFGTEHVGDENTESEVERMKRNNEVVNEGNASVDSIANKFPSLVLCGIDEVSDAENENSATIKRDNTCTSQCTLREMAEEEQVVDSSEFFRQLEISQSEEIMSVAERKLKSSPSETGLGDSGLSSFGADIYTSTSSHEWTPNESEVPSLVEDLKSENQDFIFKSVTDGLLLKEEDDNDANMCLLSNDLLEDEGFSGFEPVLDSQRSWDESPLGPSSEVISESCENDEIVQHSGQITLPLFATAQQDSDLGALGQQELTNQQQESPSPVSEFCNETRNIEVCSPIDSYFQKAKSPIATSPERTLEYLYQHNSGASYLQQWTQGTEVDFCNWHPLEEGLHVNFKESYTPAGDSDVTASVPFQLNKSDFEVLPSHKDHWAHLSPPLEDHNFPKQSRECGEGPNQDGETVLDLQEIISPSTKDSLEELLDVPFENLTVSERRRVAQVLESEWGNCSFIHDLKENNLQRPTTMAEGVQSEDLLYTSLFRPRRAYQRAWHSMKELQDIVERDSLLEDRRAQARQAEYMWGRAAFSSLAENIQTGI